MRKKKTQVAYVGKVKLEKYHDGKFKSRTFHNAGTPALFTVLLKAMQGGSARNTNISTVLAYEMPCFFRIVAARSEDALKDWIFTDGVLESVTLANNIGFESKNLSGTTSSPALSFRTFIYRQTVKTGNNNGLELYFVLCDGTDNNHPLAYVDTGESGEYEIGDDDVHVITWTMQFVNVE